MNTFTLRSIAILVVAVILAATPMPTSARVESRLKDIATLQGVSPMPLVGYGLVVGLNKTGDRRQTIFSTQTLANMLSRFGVQVAADDMKVENIAAVLVTAELHEHQPDAVPRRRMIGPHGEHLAVGFERRLEAAVLEGRHGGRDGADGVLNT